MQDKRKNNKARKLFIALISVVMITGFVFLFVAASKNKREGSCKGILISFKQKNGTMYADTASIRNWLMESKKLNPVGKKLEQLNIPLLEKSVDTKAWVKSTEAYMGNSNWLHIKITQRKPLARVFASDGNSFYLDTDGEKVLVQGSFTSQVPVFTGFPNDAVKMNKEDSALFVQIKAMSQFISQNAFWKAQVEQININKENEFEIIPKVGSALILFGHGSNVEKKFDKLLTFYRNGLNNIGWGYYDTLDIRYEGQVVASRKKQEKNPNILALEMHNVPEQELK